MSAKVPYFSVDLGDEEKRAILEVLESGWLTTGPQVRAFENELAEYIGVPHVVALNSCTAALHLALEAIGIGAGDHVLLPSLTFAATAEVILYLGGIPVFVDTQDDGCMDLDHAKHLLERLDKGAPVHGLKHPSRPAKAIMPMHYAGRMIDMTAMAALAEDFGLRVIEDAAHSFPSFQIVGGNTKRAGSLSDVGCFSFYANKCITTGEGGAAATHCEERAERMRRMSVHNLSRSSWQRDKSRAHWEYEIHGQGYKYNMTDYAAALGRVQLKRSDGFAADRLHIAKRYQSRLKDIPGISCLHHDSGAEHSWHLLVVQCTPPLSRDAILDALNAQGIGSSVHWRPLHMQPLYREQFAYKPEHCAKAAAIWTSLASLPIFPGMREDQVDTVCDALKGLTS